MQYQTSAILLFLFPFLSGLAMAASTTDKQ